MKNDKVKRIICIIIISIIIQMIIMSFINISLAEDMNQIYSHIDGGTVATKAGKALWIINTVGIVVAVCMIAYIGLKYILASPDGKADLKKQMITYFIGALLLASGTTLLNIIANFAYNNI